MATTEFEEGREHFDLTHAVEKIYSNLRTRLDRNAPVSLKALIKSRSVEVEPNELLFSLFFALVELPEAQQADPRRSLTPGELKTITRGGFDTTSREQKGLNPLARGVLEFSSLIAQSLTVPAAAKRLDVNDSRIRQRLTKRTLYGFKIGREWKLPQFQFTDDGEIPGIAKVISVLPTDLHPVEVSKWFHAPNLDLYSDKKTEQPMTPLDWLRSGYDPKQVAELAEHL